MSLIRTSPSCAAFKPKRASSYVSMGPMITSIGLSFMSSQARSLSWYSSVSSASERSLR